MKIVLKQEWLGNPKGSTLDIRKHYAEELIERGAAKAAPKASGKKASDDK